MPSIRPATISLRLLALAGLPQLGMRLREARGLLHLIGHVANRGRTSLSRIDEVFDRDIIPFPSHAYRAAVVDGVLATAASGDAGPLPARDLGALAHAGLESQLKGHVDRSLSRPRELC